MSSCRRILVSQCRRRRRDVVDVVVVSSCRHVVVSSCRRVVVVVVVSRCGRVLVDVVASPSLSCRRCRVDVFSSRLVVVSSSLTCRRVVVSLCRRVVVFSCRRVVVSLCRRDRFLHNMAPP